MERAAVMSFKCSQKVLSTSPENTHDTKRLFCRLNVHNVRDRRLGGRRVAQGFVRGLGKVLSSCCAIRFPPNWLTGDVRRLFHEG